MSLYLSEVYHDLPSSELLRIQKNLKIILRNQDSPDSLKYYIRQSYQRAGRPLDVLDRSGLKASFFRLVESFGVLHADQMDAALKSELLRNPYTIWTDECNCHASAEALDLLYQDIRFKKEDFLLGFLARIGARERREWMQWWQMNAVVSSERDRIYKLYTHLAILRSADLSLFQEDVVDIDLPEYLNDVFADDPRETPVAWYYREVLPLYHSLRETEEQHSAGLNGVQKRVLNMLKTGRAFVRAEKPTFGEKTRYRLIVSRERVAALVPAAPVVANENNPAVSESRQEVLF
ncbi:MAG: hypothetical protein KDK34_13535 [Leptospiraceae bacterium]|nr:hypothetical protein [Leptospiraceae bacterium]